MSKKVRDLEMKERKPAEAKNEKKVEPDNKKNGNGPGVCVELLF